MSISIEHDRAAQFLVAGDPNLDFRAAQLRLERAALHVTVDDPAEPWVQAALLALTRCGGRMFRGGVHLGAWPDCRAGLALYPASGLRGQLSRLGAVERPPPAGALHIHLGVDAPPQARLVCWGDGWDAAVAPQAPASPVRPANPVSGVLAASMAAHEAFRILVLGDLRAGRAMRRQSAWGPQAPEDASIKFLPTSLWLLGLGNLGQATLFILSLLPYADPALLSLVLHDFDRAGPENLPVQILTEHGWIDRRKVRCAADWAEGFGFSTALMETPFAPKTGPSGDDPRILLAGVDNLKARRWAASGAFDLVIDAGLGATAADAFELRLHAFPGARSPDQAWPEPASAPDEAVLNPALQKAVEDGEIDLCGAMTIAGKSVGVPCTAMAAAAVQVGQVLRALATGACCDLVDMNLSGEPAVFKPMAGLLPASLPFVRSLNA